MATPQLTSPTAQTPVDLPPFEPGDHLDQATFHARYQTFPEEKKAELIGGIVYMPAALRADHGDVHGELMAWLTMYKASTPGTRSLDNATIILADDSEPQPDACLLVLPERGGQTRQSDEGYIMGAPEFVAEVSSSSEAYDLHSKRRDYERHGVQEYLVLTLRERKAVWFVRDKEHFTELTPGKDGIYRSGMFGGLWLDARALLACDTKRVHEILQQGLQSEEHQRLIETLS